MYWGLIHACILLVTAHRTPSNWHDAEDRAEKTVRYMTSLTCMQGLLLTTYLKFLIADPEDASLRSLAEEVFDRYSR